MNDLKLNYSKHENNQKPTLSHKMMALIIAIIFSHSSNGQLKYLPSNVQADAGLGIEPVAMLFTETYESNVALNDNKVIWIQINLRNQKN